MNVRSLSLPVFVLALGACSSNADPKTAPDTMDTGAPTAGTTGQPPADVPTATPTAAAEEKPAAKPASEADKKKALDEAKRVVGLMARSAVGAFEREQIGPERHALCKTAAPVPAKLPNVSEPYKSSDSDWGGDDQTGWRCLKILITDPVPAQYTYTAGSTPKLAARKLHTGDATSFEACAELDLEPGGKTTLICTTGKVDKAKSQVTLAKDLTTDAE